MDADAPVTPDLLGPVPVQHQRAAERVRQHLVALRGGAPFLSPNDAVVLVGWLDTGVPIPSILVALERAADRRRRERRRVPLSLGHAVAELKRAASPLAAAPAAAPAPSGLSGIARRVAALAAAHPALNLIQLAETIGALPPGDAAAEDCLAAVARWLDAAWHELGDAGRAPWRDAARVALGDVANLLDDGELDQVLDEHARGLLREALPALSAAAILAEVEA